MLIFCAGSHSNENIMSSTPLSSFDMRRTVDMVSATAKKFGVVN